MFYWLFWMTFVFIHLVAPFAVFSYPYSRNHLSDSSSMDKLHHNFHRTILIWSPYFWPYFWLTCRYFSTHVLSYLALNIALVSHFWVYYAYSLKLSVIPSSFGCCIQLPTPNSFTYTPSLYLLFCSALSMTPAVENGLNYAHSITPISILLSSVGALGPEYEPCLHGLGPPVHVPASLRL